MLSWTALRARRWQLLPAGGRWARQHATRKARHCSTGKARQNATRKVRQYSTRKVRDEQGEEEHDGLEQELQGCHDRSELVKHEHHAEGDRHVQGENESLEPDLTPEDVRPPFKDAFTIPEGQVRTHRVRRHGNAQLPLSPVIDPVFVAARNRWKMKKAQPPKTQDMTPFQKKLHANAYAQALATPVRESNMTDTHLPNFFLLPLSLHKSPQPPHTPTWVPTKLWQSTLFANRPDSPRDITRGGPQSYIDLSAGTIDMLTQQNARLRDLPTQAHQRHFAHNTKREMKLRPDFPAFILELLRRQLLNSLVWFFKHPNTGLLSSCDGGAYAIPSNTKTEVAAVLYLCPIYRPEIEVISKRVAHEVLEAHISGRRTLGLQVATHGRLHAGSLRSAKITNPPPMQNPASVYPAPRYPVTQIEGEGRAIPVYSLYDLLGGEKLRELLRKTVFEEGRCVLLQGKEVRTVKAQMALLRLQGFLLQEGSSKDRDSGKAGKIGKGKNGSQEEGW